MEARHVEHLIIGFGKAGKTLAARIAKNGGRVTLVERDRAMYGGTCINIGCLPSKSLILDAYAARRDGRESQQAFVAAMSAKTALTSKLRAANYAKLDALDGVTVLDGSARFLGPRTVLVQLTDGGELMIQAKHVYINTGARPRIPDIPGIRETPGVYDSTGMLSLPELPRRVAVLGAGFIGLEFASMMADFGAEVCVLQHDYRVLPNEDADVVQAIHGMLEKQGVRIVTNANVTRVYAGEHGAPVVIEADVDGTATHFSADAMLVAVGRVPETAGLNLTAAGIETDARGAIIVDDLLRTTADQVWAMGDCNGGPQHTYISLDDSRIVWSQIGSSRESAMPYRRTERRNVPSCVFLHVPYARVGLNEHDATAQGVPVHVHTLPVFSVPKAVVMRETEGLLKALTDPSTERILGVTLLCPEAHEMINTVKVAMDCGADANYMRNAIFTHPTMTEIFNDLFA